MNAFKALSLAAVLTVGAAAAEAASVSVLSKVPTAWDGVTAGTTLSTGGGTWTIEPEVLAGSDAGVGGYKSPFNPTGPHELAGWEDLKYYSVGSFLSPGYVPSPAILSFSEDKSMLKFIWGSADLYNALVFKDEFGAVVATVSGGDIIPPATAGGGASVVKITGLSFRTVEFYADYGLKTDRAAFEFANISTVPLPAGGVLLLTAMGGVAALRRRKQA